MATIAIMLGGAVLNATAFIGGNYLAKVISGSSSAELQLERERHDKAMEKFQKDYAAHQEKRMAYIDFRIVGRVIRIKPLRTYQRRMKR